ncbi:hypothetical protein OIE69_43835 (plasmid) [Actinacidiphila glaucinigra]|uniref:hypothetical protein n=1 Tax=Actinacidiphila glaucinigra TaxID=235986 RepID=UPI002DD8A14F|nr:hypothetical protein [Actinacidiphila glaucinigra]WSD65838.1 hypothetical protein OIE69_43835 [Actinacidiphila glaucinigra]
MGCSAGGGVTERLVQLGAEDLLVCRADRHNVHVPVLRNVGTFKPGFCSRSRQCRVEDGPLRGLAIATGRAHARCFGPTAVRARFSATRPLCCLGVCTSLRYGLCPPVPFGDGALVTGVSLGYLHRKGLVQLVLVGCASLCR